MEDGRSPATAATCKFDFNDSVDHHQRTLNPQDSLSTESMSTEWTDEKHSLYLKSMEASFVDQLYNSLDLLASRSQKEHSSDAKSTRQIHSSTRVASGQFKVLQAGYWGKINFERDEPQLEKADESGALLANRWIRHFRSGCRHQVVAPALQERDARSEGKMSVASSLTANSKESYTSDSQLCRHDLVGSDTEMSGQNFVDEEIEGNKTNHVCSSKRMKTLIIAPSSNDQVVPFGTFPMTEDVAETFVSSENGKQRTGD